MRHLLAQYFISDYSYKNTELVILCLLHELRIMTANQLHILLNSEYEISIQNVQKKLIILMKSELINRIRSDTDNKTYCYYLTKNGHNNIGGMYSFPKVPEYNLNHHLMVTNALIDTLEIVGNNPHLKVIQTERRQAFEMKDFNKERKGKVFTVSDYLFRFKSQKKGREVNWYFEIELTSKTKRRYMNGIFPKYIKDLQKNEDAHLFYVTPSNYIFEELERYKKYFSRKNSGESEVFERLHIIAQNNFNVEFKQLVQADKFINW